MAQWFDEACIEVRSGNGGKGHESYRHRTDRKKEPNGGNGGKGGDVWLEADENVTGLLHLQYNQRFEAENGEEGGYEQKAGRGGKDLILKVPCGTTVINGANRLKIRDLVANGERVMVVKGGRGGAGNHTGRGAQPGAPGESLPISLNLRLVADIVLIGIPSSGKSTLLHRLTHAKLPLALYPFATKLPHLGACRTKDYGKLVLCELPSLLRGSSEGHGVGNHYLKHLERGRLLFYMMEPAGAFASDVFEAYKILREELEKFDPEFLNYPFFVIINKIDLIAAPELKKMRTAVKKLKVPVFFISAQTGEGIGDLMKEAQEKLRYG
jgi:GTP-binding protein